MKWYYWLLIVYVFMVYVWTWYLSAMSLWRVKRETPEKINIYIKIFAYPMLFLGLIADAVLNITLGTIFFLKLPELDRLLFTARLDKEAKKGSGWRKAQAQWWCSTFLNPFDPTGLHCGCEEECD